MKKVIGVSTQALYNKSLTLALHKISQLKIDFIEIVNEGYHTLNRHNYKVHMNFLEEAKLKNIIHAPFSDVNIGSLNEKVRRISLELLFETFEIAHEMGSALVVIHPGHHSPLSSRFPKAYEKVQKRSLEEISKISQKIGITVALENMPSYPILDGQTPERIKELIDGTEILVTFDIGHLNTVNAQFDKFIELLEDRIIYTHLSDNHGTNDSHLALGEGNIPWKTLLNQLKDIPMSLEVKTFEDILKSLEFLNKIPKGV